ncbi:MAG: hypothetical protein RBS99_15010 [Rhodospirillales bacterium]|nr:hypothetical protein [Rhodospirillales bacterium]
MKRRSRTLEIFSLSFLDVISCGFGAVVLLVLISDTAELSASADAAATAAMLGEVLEGERTVDHLSEELSRQSDALQDRRTLLANFERRAAALRQSLAAATRQAEELAAQKEGLETVQTSLKRAAITPATAEKRDDEVGGIPVDSDYVIFIVDTSGSMQSIWARVTAEMKNVLAIHPKVKGFQIMNDMGTHLISGYRGQWIPDTPSRRDGAFKLFMGWTAASNSSPIEGLEAALRLYAKAGVSLSIYIFGDDYTGSSYEPVLEMIDRLNTNRVTGGRLAKIHGVGFISPQTTNRFGILMREVARRNGGTFLALRR